MQKRLTKAQKAAYNAMTTAASEVVMRNRGRQYRDGHPEYVVLNFRFGYVFPDDFPVARKVEIEGEKVSMRVNAIKLLNWLYKNGYATYDAAMLVKSTKYFEYFQKGIEKQIFN